MQKKFECHECFAEGKIALLNEEVEDTISYCPFCGCGLEEPEEDGDWDE